MNLNQTKLNK